MSAGVKVKICGLVRRRDVTLAEQAGADYVGVILSSGFDRSVKASEAAQLVRGVRAAPVAVLVDESPDGAEQRAAALGARVIQLHGEEPPEVVEEIGRRGAWALWKSVRVREGDDVRRAVDRYGRMVDGLLLEGYREGIVGGGGVRLDLEGLARVRPEVPSHLELILAGGLTPANVAEAVARFHPAVVDVSSGVERDRGSKDADLVRLFVQAVRDTDGTG